MDGSTTDFFFWIFVEGDKNMIATGDLRYHAFIRGVSAAIRYDAVPFHEIVGERGISRGLSALNAVVALSGLVAFNIVRRDTYLGDRYYQKRVKNIARL